MFRFVHFKSCAKAVRLSRSLPKTVHIIKSIPKEIRLIKSPETWKPREAAAPQAEPREPSRAGDIANNMQRYTLERKMFTESLHLSDREEAEIELDVLEAFMIHNDEESCLCVLKHVILNMAILNCSEGKNEAFPIFALPSVAKQAGEDLVEMIGVASKTYEFKKVATRSAHVLASIIKGQIDSKLDKAV